MGNKVRRVQYFYATVKDEPGAAYRLLTQVASAEVNLLAFRAIPMGPGVTQLVLFPDRVDQLARAAEQNGVVLTGPHDAFLIQGDDRMGALVDWHQRLTDARVNVYASDGVTDGHGHYGYVLYVRPEDYEAAATVLGV
ncbi:MAG TPA: hypothetical protein VD788_02280 [Candidatus Polarisedimenticolaceae bacterium]|nr:hypothetical protein [Candidatus Polarisedimenticolaceae bacterium]